MIKILPKPLITLARALDFELYLVGGSVRDFLRGKLSEQPDYDICACGDEAVFADTALTCGFTVSAVFKATGTVKLRDGEGNEYEFTRWRSDKYVRGMHRPAEICFTNDIACDARRRDFCANAVYYDVRNELFCDPLGGIDDIKNKLLRTVAPAKKVFGEDGLRLLRLARIAAQTGFAPDEECLAGARENADLINDIVPERIYTELNLLLHADEKACERDAPYRGLKILDETGVLDRILPELTLGRGMEQRSDFHDHDVLEHSLRAVRYSDSCVRWAALLHDVGKPFCTLRDGNSHYHDREGERIAREILTRLKAPKALTEETATLVRLHMRDYALNMREGKVRKELVACYPLLDKLFALKQADFSACKDDLSPAPVVVKWKKILDDMRREGAPLTLKELAVNGKDLLATGIPPVKTGEILKLLLDECALNGRLNEREKLLARAQALTAM